jgi:hypothetical protein
MALSLFCFGASQKIMDQTSKELESEHFAQLFKGAILGVIAAVYFILITSFMSKPETEPRGRP